MLAFFSLLLLVSCDDDGRYPTEQEWKTGMDTVRFNESVLANFKKYEELKNFLEANADTILSTGNKGDYYVASIPYSDPDRLNIVPYEIPDLQKPEFSRIVKKLPNLVLFRFDKEKNVYFKVHEHLGFLNFDHYLYWHPIIEGDNSEERFKDTRLDSTCKYRIVAWWYEGR